MATIKTTGTGTGLRVLTKTAAGIQRVSCSCCEDAVCCMYPADQLGVGYTEDDLPDTIDVEGLILGVPERIIVSRSGSFYGPINQSIFGGGAFSEFIFVTTGVEGIRWFRNTTNGEPIGNGEPCLILGDGNFTAGDNSVEDQFAASYTVNFNEPYPDRGLPATQTFVRESLCVWRSTSGYDYGTGTMFYDTLTYGGGVLPYEPTKWAVNATNMLATSMVKTGAQNSPIGTYSGVVPSITVS